MTLVVKDRVKETTTTTGTGTITLAGAAAGFQAFSVLGDGNTTYYAIVDSVTADWEVGIGTYTLSGTTLARTTVLSSSNAGVVVNLSAGNKDVFVTYPAEKSVLIDPSGNVGIGTSSPTYKVDVSGTGRFTGSLSVLTGATDTAGLIVGADATVANTWTIARDSISTGDLKFIGNTTERMRITSAGSLLVATTTVAGLGQSIQANGTRISTMSGTGSNVHAEYKNDNGTVGYILSSGSSTSYVTSSDYRLKEDWVAVANASTRVNALKPINFAWISSGERVDGFLAHELADVVPEAVTGTKDAMRDEEYEVTPAVLDDEGTVVTPAVMGTRSVPDYQGIDQSKLVPLLTAALQEALAAIDDLTARVVALEGQP